MSTIIYNVFYCLTRPYFFSQKRLGESETPQSELPIFPFLNLEMMRFRKVIVLGNQTPSWAITANLTHSQRRLHSSLLKILSSCLLVHQSMTRWIILVFGFKGICFFRTNGVCCRMKCLFRWCDVNFFLLNKKWKKIIISAFCDDALKFILYLLTSHCEGMQTAGFKYSVCYFS